MRSTAWSPESTPPSTWRHDGTDGGMAIRSKRTAVISVGVVYFYITSVHPRGNLTSRERSVSPFPLLRGWGFISEAMMNSQQTFAPYGPWVSMHLNEAFPPRLHTTQGFLNSLSLVKHYIKHNNNSRPAPLPILPLSLSNFLLWHFSSWSTSPKTPFICFLWRTHLHFLKRLTSHSGLLPLSVKQHRVVSRHS